jgi:hypothetical protein
LYGLALTDIFVPIAYLGRILRKYHTFYLRRAQRLGATYEFRVATEIIDGVGRDSGARDPELYSPFLRDPSRSNVQAVQRMKQNKHNAVSMRKLSTSIVAMNPPSALKRRTPTRA